MKNSRPPRSEHATTRRRHRAPHDGDAHDEQQEQQQGARRAQRVAKGSEEECQQRHAHQSQKQRHLAAAMRERRQVTPTMGGQDLVGVVVGRDDVDVDRSGETHHAVDDRAVDELLPA